MVTIIYKKSVKTLASGNGNINFIMVHLYLLTLSLLFFFRNLLTHLHYEMFFLKLT